MVTMRDDAAREAGTEPGAGAALAGGPVPDGAALLDGAVLAFVERFASVLVAAGIPAMPARVLAALHVADSGSLTSAELTRMLRISPAAVSGAVRYLGGLGLVHKERVPGSRRDYYRMPPNVWHEVIRLQNQVLARWTSLLKEGIGVVGAASPAGARMAEYAAFFEFMNAEFPALLARWEAEGR